MSTLDKDTGATGTTSSAAASADTSHVAGDMPHPQASASTAGTEIPPDREPGEIRKDSKVVKYLKAAFVIATVLTLLILGFLVGKRLFAGTPKHIEIITAELSASGVGAWFKKVGASIAGFAASGWAKVKGLFRRSPATTTVVVDTPAAAAA